MYPPHRRERLRELDEQLVTAARSVRVLATLSWPAEAEGRFLEGWRQGRPELPQVPLERPDHREADASLVDLLGRLDLEDPAEAFLARTATSCRDAVALLVEQGLPAFTLRSRAMYGAPRQQIVPGGPTHLDAAAAFIAATAAPDPDQSPRDQDSTAAAAWLQERLDGVFAEPLPVELSPGLRARATAGSRRVRLQAEASFSRLELAQLLEHEALVHAATKRNGLDQPVLRSLGMSAPRTTATQEGLATLAELITDTMDLRRLRRIALRVPAVDMALEGADFIEVFTFFAEHGQEPAESFGSTARIFRGGDVRGGVAFTKDVVYLKGLMLTHTFLLKAIQAGRRELPARLFSGRLTLGDALALEPCFEAGLVEAPRRLPPWVEQTSCLAAYLSWSAFSHRIDLGGLELEHFAATD